MHRSEHRQHRPKHRRPRSELRTAEPVVQGGLCVNLSKILPEKQSARGRSQAISPQTTPPATAASDPRPGAPVAEFQAEFQADFQAASSLPPPSLAEDRDVCIVAIHDEVSRVTRASVCSDRSRTGW